MKTKRCHIVDDTGKIIINGANVIRLVSKDFDCKVSSHVVISYYSNVNDMLIDKDMIIKIFPIKSVLFFESEE
jgi:hypothetical protein